jgi:hypothetical protein
MISAAQGAVAHYWRRRADESGLVSEGFARYDSTSTPTTPFLIMVANRVGPHWASRTP